MGNLHALPPVCPCCGHEKLPFPVETIADLLWYGLEDDSPAGLQATIRHVALRLAGLCGWHGCADRLVGAIAAVQILGVRT